MSYELTARVKQVLPAVTGMSAKGPWGRVTVVVEYTDGNFTRTLALENKSKYEEFAKLQPGQFVKFKFDVTSREWQGKYFTTANCFAWDVQGGAKPAQAESSKDMPF